MSHLALLASPKVACLFSNGGSSAILGDADGPWAEINRQIRRK
jgi:hypothetical protein